MEDVISSADKPAAAEIALPDKLDEADALELELCAAQLSTLEAKAELIAERRRQAEKRIEAKYQIGPGVSVDLPSRRITRH